MGWGAGRGPGGWPPRSFEARRAGKPQEGGCGWGPHGWGERDGQQLLKSHVVRAGRGQQKEKTSLSYPRCRRAGSGASYPSAILLGRGGPNRGLVAGERRGLEEEVASPPAVAHAYLSGEGGPRHLASVAPEVEGVFPVPLRLGLSVGRH